MAAALDSRLSAAETDALTKIAGTMVPEDAALGMPGADDPAILEDMVRSIGRDLPLVREALAAIAARSGGAFAEMDQAAREALINEWYPGGGASALALGRVIVSAYYRDDRVLMALGHEARAPFPKGYVLEQGDWSLLDVVRKRQPFWRDDRVSPPGDR
ncbi:MAG: hypothetical protein FD144_479 [Rhodospirillaceae bacterium]|nr:MAG: hypothetical protein FD144_479 [Rhodospirillaceae bacterium]